MNSFLPSITDSLHLPEGMVLAVLADVLTHMMVIRGSLFTFWCVLRVEILLERCSSKSSYHLRSFDQKLDDRLSV